MLSDIQTNNHASARIYLSRRSSFCCFSCTLSMRMYIIKRKVAEHKTYFVITKLSYFLYFVRQPVNLKIYLYKHVRDDQLISVEHDLCSKYSLTDRITDHLLPLLILISNHIIGIAMSNNTPIL